MGAPSKQRAPAVTWPPECKSGAGKLPTLLSFDRWPASLRWGSWERLDLGTAGPAPVIQHVSHAPDPAAWPCGAAPERGTLTAVSSFLYFSFNNAPPFPPSWALIGNTAAFHHNPQVSDLSTQLQFY